MRYVFVLLAAFRLANAADSSIAAYFPPDTKVVFGVNVRSLIDNPLFADTVAEIRAKSAGLLAQTPLASFDLLKDLDEIILATNGKGEKPPAIAVLRGRFQLDVLAKTATKYHDVAILQTPQQPDGALALIDDSTALAGATADIHAAIDRHAAASSGSAALLARVETLRNRYGIWGFGDGIEKSNTPARPGDLSAIDRFEVGLGLDRGLRINAEIHLRTAQDAEKMTATLRLVEGMINASKSKTPMPKGSGMELRAEKGTLKFSLTIPEAEIKKAIKEERDTLAAALSTRLPALVAPPARKAKAVTTTPAGPAFTIEQAGTPQQGAPEAKTVTNPNGDTVILTLPGKQ